MVRDRVLSVAERVPALLAWLGVAEHDRAREALVLAAPVMVSGGLRVLIRVSDFVFVGLALGDAGIAALELGFQYFFIPFGLSLALTSGTISVVSRYVGADQRAEADFAVKQSLWLALCLAVPITIAAWLYARPLIALLTADQRTIVLGAAYLQVVMLGLVPRFWSMIAARALAGTGDTQTPMYVRLLSLPVNLVLNAALVFGLGPFPELGVVGAAVGTVAGHVLAAAVFLYLFVADRRAVRLRVGGKQWDTGVAAEIVRVGAPLAGTRLARTLGRFPFLFVLGVFGPGALAAYAIGRRVILLAMMPAWGFATAASTLVGQHVGAGDPDRADAYGWATVRVAVAVQLCIGVVLALTARPIALVFGTESVDLTVQFIRVFGLSVGGFALARTVRGGLRGAGDTRWPLYGTLVATYLVKLPIALLALPRSYVLSLGPISVTPGLGWGYPAVFAAILAAVYLKAAVNLVRYWSDAWKRVAREAGIGGVPGD